MDCGLIIKKPRGLFAKVPRVDRYPRVLTWIWLNPIRRFEIRRCGGRLVGSAQRLSPGDDSGEKLGAVLGSSPAHAARAGSASGFARLAWANSRRTESASRPLVCFSGLIDTTIKGLTILLSIWTWIDYYNCNLCDVIYQCSRQGSYDKINAMTWSSMKTTSNGYHVNWDMR